MCAEDAVARFLQVLPRNSCLSASKMFRLNHRAACLAAPPDRTRHLLRRALLFGGGLALLWLALQLAPTPSPADAPTPFAEIVDPADGVAVRPLPTAPRLLSAGNFAVLVLLAGGAGLAFFLRRRSREGGGPVTPLQSMGQMTLAPNQHLRLVRCGDDVLLLGVTTGQITLLKRYDFTEFAGANSIKSNGAVVAEAAANPSTSSTSGEASFASLLKQQVGRSLNVQQTQAPC